MINNHSAATFISECQSDLERIGHMIEALGSTHPISGILTRYSLMKASASLECAYKTIIADYYKSFSPELEQFINRSVLDANMNATYENICKMLQRFSEDKNTSFKNTVQALPAYERLHSSFSSLSRARNDVAHGSSISISFTDVVQYFNDATIIIEKLDEQLVGGDRSI